MTSRPDGAAGPPATSLAPASVRTTVGPALAAFVIGFGVAAMLRYGLVEPAAIAHGCVDDPTASLCDFRDLVVASFHARQPGWLALIAGAAGWWLAPRADTPGRRRLARLLGLTAIGFGAVGLVLYSFEPAAVGLVLGATTLARLPLPARSGATTSR